MKSFRDTGHVEVPCEGCVTVVLGSIGGVVISKKMKIIIYFTYTVQERYTL